MSRVLHFLSLLMLGLGLLLGVSGCQPSPEADDSVLRIGVIASLSGPARSWGEVTVRCAQVIADYHNERGGIEIDGHKVPVELIIKDDALDASLATSAAHDLILAGVNYVIGPLGDAAVASAARVMDGAGVFYVHYGFNQEGQSSSSLGIMGMPLPEQSLPLLFKYLRQQEAVESVLIMAYGTEEGIKQKGDAEYLAKENELSLLKFARFDISEESFEPDLNSEMVRVALRRVVAAEPDAVIIAGCPPEKFVVLVERLRDGGYDGIIGTPNFQDAHLLAKLGETSDGVFYVGGEPADNTRSEYYNELKGRYLRLSDAWSEEADTKLYALEFILACIQHAGLRALEDTSSMYHTLQEIRFQDPFYEDNRLIPIHEGIDGIMPRQIRTPIRISKMMGGRAKLVEESKWVAE